MENVTCIVPTKDRPHFVDRLLYFFAAQGLASPVIIADSSVSAASSEVDRILGAYGLDNVRLRRFDPETPFYEKVARSFDCASTPYSYLCADDDFIFSSGVKACADVLDKEVDLAAAAGQLFVYNFDATQNPSPFLPNSLSIYPAKSEVADNMRHRLYFHLRDYNATFYSVYRTESAARAFANTIRYSTNMRTAELLSSTMVLAEGGRRLIDTPFGLRTSHAEALHRELSPLAAELEKEGVRKEIQHAFYYLADRFSSSEQERQKFLDDLGEGLVHFLHRARVPGGLCMEVKKGISAATDGEPSSTPLGSQGSDIVLRASDKTFSAMKADKGELYMSIVLSECAPFGFKEKVNRSNFTAFAERFAKQSVVSGSNV